MRSFLLFGPAQTKQEIATREHLRKSLRKRCRKYRKALKECRESFSEEPVHELRIETRRLFALIALLHSCISGRSLDRAEKRLGKLFKRFSALRDAQVQLDYFRKNKESHPEAVPLCGALLREERRLIRRVQKKLATARRGRASALYGLCAEMRTPHWRGSALRIWLRKHSTRWTRRMAKLSFCDEGPILWNRRPFTAPVWRLRSSGIWSSCCSRF